MKGSDHRIRSTPSKGSPDLNRSGRVDRIITPLPIEGRELIRSSATGNRGRTGSTSETAVSGSDEPAPHLASGYLCLLARWLVRAYLRERESAPDAHSRPDSILSNLDCVAPPNPSCEPEVPETP